MGERTVLSLILLIAGTVVAFVTAWRINSGKSYFAMSRVSRGDDPFSFWLSVGIPGVLAVIAIAAGIWGFSLERRLGDPYRVQVVVPSLVRRPP